MWGLRVGLRDLHRPPQAFLRRAAWHGGELGLRVAGRGPEFGRQPSAGSVWPEGPTRPHTSQREDGPLARPPRTRSKLMRLQLRRPRKKRVNERRGVDAPAVRGRG